jgi:hypothetical protein
MEAGIDEKSLLWNSACRHWTMYSNNDFRLHLFKFSR